MQRVSRCIVWCFAVHCSQFSPANLCGLDKYMPWVNVFRLAHGLVLFNRFHFISSDERRLRELNLGLFLIYDRKYYIALFVSCDGSTQNSKQVTYVEVIRCFNNVFIFRWCHSNGVLCR